MSYQFSGSEYFKSSKVSVPSAESFTFVIWVKPDVGANSSITPFAAISQTNQELLPVYETDAVNEGNCRVFISGNNSSSSVTTGKNPNVSEWKPLIIIYDSDNLVFLADYADSSDTAIFLPQIISLSSTVVGTYFDGTDSSAWKGKLAHLAVWHRALNGLEIIALKGGINPTQIPGLFSYTPFVSDTTDIIGFHDDWAPPGAAPVVSTDNPPVDAIPVKSNWLWAGLEGGTPVFTSAYEALPDGIQTYIKLNFDTPPAPSEGNSLLGDLSLGADSLLADGNFESSLLASLLAQANS